MRKRQFLRCLLNKAYENKLYYHGEIKGLIICCLFFFSESQVISLSSLLGDPWLQGEQSCWEGGYVTMGPEVSSSCGRLAIEA